MSNAKFDGADMSEVVMSKAYAVGASFKGKFLPYLLQICSVNCQFHVHENYLEVKSFG